MSDFYKLIALALANRIKNIVGKVVSYFQGTKILDIVLIAHEAMIHYWEIVNTVYYTSLILRKSRVMLIAIFYFWFLKRLVLRRNGWLKSIWCISSVRCLVPINCATICFFQSFGGIRQGEPLLPYLFCD